MKIINKKLKNLFLIKHNVFKDKRGYFKEIIRENKINRKFPFVVMSYSKKKLFVVYIYKLRSLKENL